MAYEVFRSWRRVGVYLYREGEIRHASAVLRYVLDGYPELLILVGDVPRCYIYEHHLPARIIVPPYITSPVLHLHVEVGIIGMDTGGSGIFHSEIGDGDISAPVYPVTFLQPNAVIIRESGRSLQFEIVLHSEYVRKTILAPFPAVGGNVDVAVHQLLMGKCEIEHNGEVDPPVLNPVVRCVAFPGDQFHVSFGILFLVELASGPVIAESGVGGIVVQIDLHLGDVVKFLIGAHVDAERILF